MVNEAHRNFKLEYSVLDIILQNDQPSPYI